MATRYPLVVDTTDGNKIKELPVGDNLDLTNSSLLNATSVQTQTLSNVGEANLGMAPCPRGLPPPRAKVPSPISI